MASTSSQVCESTEPWAAPAALHVDTTALNRTGSHTTLVDTTDRRSVRRPSAPPPPVVPTSGDASLRPAHRRWPVQP